MIRGLLLIAQALIWLLLLRFVMRSLGALFGRGQVRPRARPQVRAPEDLVLDRVCHSYVPRSRALTARVAGSEQWFCSAACRERALAAVARAS
jgi:uncharacterized protein